MPALLAAADQCKAVLDEQEVVGITPLMVAAALGSTEVGHVTSAFALLP